MKERVGAAAVNNRHFQNGETTCCQLSKRLPDNSTIFAAEATAISLALNYYQLMGPVHHDVVVYSWVNVLFAGNWGWRHWEPFNLPYHEPALVIEWQGHTCSFLLGTKPLWHWRKWMSRPTSKRDPWPRYRPTGKCPLYRYETTGQLLHSEVGSNQLECSCTWQRSCETNTGAKEEVPASNQSWRGCNHPTSNWPYQGHQIPYLIPRTANWLSPLLSNTDHMLLECALLQECRDEYYTVDSLNALFETIPETCNVEFLREAVFFYLIWCNLLTPTSPQMCTIWSDLSNLFREWKQLWDTFTCVGRLICPEGRVSSLNKSNPIQSIKSIQLFQEVVFHFSFFHECLLDLEALLSKFSKPCWGLLLPPMFHWGLGLYFDWSCGHVCGLVTLCRFRPMGRIMCWKCTKIYVKCITHISYILQVM